MRVMIKRILQPVALIERKKRNEVLRLGGRSFVK